MRYQASRASTLLIILSVGIICGYFIFFHKRTALEGPAPAAVADSYVQNDIDNFNANGITVIKKEDGEAVFRLSADSIMRRQRSSRLFSYHNLKEIYLSGVKIDVFPYKRKSADSSGKPAIPLDDIFSALVSLGKPLTSLDDYTAGKGDGDMALLSRFLIENMALNLHLSPVKMISITSTLAIVSATDSNNIVLDGMVKITDSNNDEICASKAVWSKKNGGIYFPEGFLKDNKKYPKKKFYALDQQGNFRKVQHPPRIDYMDLLDEKEKILYAKLFKKLPPQVRFMFGIPMDYKIR